MLKPSGPVHPSDHLGRIFAGRAGQLLALALAASLAGCTAIKSTVHLAQAEQALAEARNYDSQNLAKYEYTMAIRYLEKAREENGASDYRIAENLAKRSMEWSDKAIISIERGRRGIDTLEDDIGALPSGPEAYEELLPEADTQDVDTLDAGEEFDSLDDEIELDE